MKWFPKITLFVTLIWFGLEMQSCRKQYSALPEDMTDYGWTLYESGDYLTANNWFQQSVDSDTSWKDGYNGLGWSYGKLMVLDSSISYFTKGLSKSQDPFIKTDIHSEILAGLTFSYYAQGDARNTIYYADSLLTRTTKPLEPGWSFSHDSLLNYLDVRITLAAAYFDEKKFDSTALQIGIILDSLSKSDTVVTDTSLQGRKNMAAQIQSLQDFLFKN
jgi:tetratricopeptide (TPR) repeat protein